MNAPPTGAPSFRRVAGFLLLAALAMLIARWIGVEGKPPTRSTEIETSVFDNRQEKCLEQAGESGGDVVRFDAIQTPWPAALASVDLHEGTNLDLLATAMPRATATETPAVTTSPPHDWPLSNTLAWGIDWSLPSGPETAGLHTYVLFLLVDVVDPEADASFDGVTVSLERGDEEWTTHLDFAARFPVAGCPS